MTNPQTLSRRSFLKSTGALIVAFSLPIELRAQPVPSAQELLQGAPPDQIDSWLAVAQDSSVTIFTGKVELGTGVETALSQIVAEELDTAVERVKVVQGDTGRTPDQGYTAGSKTIQAGGPPLRQAAAEARQTLLGLASARFGVPVDQLIVRDGVVSAKSDPSKKASYGELIGGQRFNQAVTGAVKPKGPDAYMIVGKSIRRVDIPAKVTGTYTYVQDVRLPGMLHGRVLRPPAVGATLVSVDEGSVRQVPGLVKVVRRGNFIGVVADGEEQAIRAARELKATWQEPAGLPEMNDLYETLRRTPSAAKVLVHIGDVEAAFRTVTKSLHATYHYPFQMHASIGPSCAVADVRDGQAMIWSGTQGPYPLRGSIAQLLGLSPANVRVIFVEASGCYGHNGADDAAADAAFLSQAVGKPVRVQWMRHDEHGWEPFGPAMVMDVRGSLDAQEKVVAWDYAVWSPTHVGRPFGGQAGTLLAGQLVGAPAAKTLFFGGERNAKHTYVFKNDRVVLYSLATSPLRPSALRGLGGVPNTFANESFMDELAAAAGADPIEFRLGHLTDPRAIAVLQTVAQRVGWKSRPSPPTGARGSRATGHGVAFVQYETENAYVATVAEVEVNRTSGEVRVKRVVVAHDCGLIINPDGLKNQIEGNVIQAISRALVEEVKFSRSGVTSLDWRSYPILTFREVPENVDIVLINRPDKPALGAGEPASCPIPAAIANAIFDATGARVRTMPFTPDRVKAALERT